MPYLSGFSGKSLFMDPDMIVTGDICELIDMADPAEAPVHVMKDQPRFEWPSVMVFNNGCCKALTPGYVDNEENGMFDFAWSGRDGGKIGSFPAEWNHCIGYQEPKKAKLYHYTQGIPCWPETMGIEDEPWQQTFRDAVSTVSWQELMGGSIHAEAVMKRVNQS